MKKFLITLLALVCLFCVVACTDNDKALPKSTASSEKDKEESPNTEKIPTPEDEYSVTVVDPYGKLYENLKTSYKAGETVVVKTHLITDTDEYVELNGKKPIFTTAVEGEEGHYLYNEYVFTMPNKNSILNISHKDGMGEGYNVALKDPNGYIINRVEGMKMAGSTYEIHAERSDLIIDINGLRIDESPQAVKNSDGEILYYSWQFVMLGENVTVDVDLALDEGFKIEDPHSLIYSVDEDGCTVTLTSPYILNLTYKSGEKIEFILVQENTLDNSVGKIYTYIFNINERESTVAVTMGQESTGGTETKRTLNFIDRTEFYKNLFDADFSGAYSPGERVIITAENGVLEYTTTLVVNGIVIQPDTRNTRWSFIMPDEDITVYAYLKHYSDDIYLQVKDKEGLIINSVDGYYGKISDSVNVRTSEKNVRLMLNGKVLDYRLAPHRNEDGEILYYWQTILLNEGENVISAYRTEEDYYTVECEDWHLLDTSHRSFYKAGEKVTVNTKLTYGVEQIYIVKVNGVTIEPTPVYGYEYPMPEGGLESGEEFKEPIAYLAGYEWSFVMPNNHVTLQIKIIEPPQDESYYYLDLIDSELLLIDDDFYDYEGVIDGYYQAGDVITVYSKCLLNIEADEDVAQSDYLYIENRGVYKYRIIMPMQDTTVKITRYKSENTIDKN